MAMCPGLHKSERGWGIKWDYYNSRRDSIHCNSNEKLKVVLLSILDFNAFKIYMGLAGWTNGCVEYENQKSLSWAKEDTCSRNAAILIMSAKSQVSGRELSQRVASTFTHFFLPALEAPCHHHHCWLLTVPVSQPPSKCSPFPIITVINLSNSVWKATANRAAFDITSWTRISQEAS